MQKLMDAIVKPIAGPGLELRQVPVPTPGPGEVLIKIHKTAICGTDVHIYNWDPWAQLHIKPPMTIGHEYVGEIAELGAVSQVFTNPQSKIARELILPGVSIAPVFTPGGKRIRLAFNGETTRHPVVASLIMECQTPVNIVSADIREIDGKIYGQTILELPADEASAERARAWLKQDGVSYEEV